MNRGLLQYLTSLQEAKGIIYVCAGPHACIRECTVCTCMWLNTSLCVCLCVCAEKGLAGLGPLSAGTPCGEEEAPQNQVISLPPSLQRPPIPWAPYTAGGLKRTTHSSLQNTYMRMWSGKPFPETRETARSYLKRYFTLIYENTCGFGADVCFACEIHLSNVIDKKFVKCTQQEWTI